MDTIAVDAMGGDFAPDAIVRGALDCARDPRCDFSIRLYGDETKIRALLQGNDAVGKISVEHTTQIIEMHDSATAALKTKRDSSIIRALEAHKAGKVQAFISAGNTGAVMAASTLILERIKGISRPTIGAFLPSANGVTLLVDAGANVDCKPLHLVQFGIMGSIFAEQTLGISKPTVGLLNVGEEQGKGNDVCVEAERLLREAPVNFVGNIEGKDILKGTVDIAVCDGFVGNIVLKFAESFPGLLKKKFRTYADQGLAKKLWMGMFMGTIKGLFKDWDYEEYGGVPLLGVRGITIIGHGNSSPKAIKHMIFKAKEMIDHKVDVRIAEAISSLSAA